MLNEMLCKTLNKMAKQAETAVQEDLDDTLLKWQESTPFVHDNRLCDSCELYGNVNVKRAR